MEILQKIITEIEKEVSSCSYNCNSNDYHGECSIDTGERKCDCGTENINEGLNIAIEIIKKYT